MELGIPLLLSVTWHFERLELSNLRMISYLLTRKAPAEIDGMTSFLMLHWELSWILRRSQRLTILYRPQGKDHLSLLFESFDSDVSSCWNACRIDYQTGKALGKPQPGKVGFVWLGLLPGGRTKKGWCLQVSVQRSYPLFRIKYWFSPDLLSQG